MTADQILPILERGALEPVYFLYGPERFYHGEIIEALTRRLITPENREFNLETFEAKEASVAEWIGAAKTLTFMGGVKLVVVRNVHEPTLQEPQAQIILDYLDRPVPETCLVLTADKIDRKRKLFKRLAMIDGAVDCSAPRESGLIPWVQHRARSRGYQLSLGGARLMIEKIGARPGFLASELDKVMTYAGEQRNISEKDVAFLVGEIKTENVFALTEALKSKNTQEAFRVLHNQLSHGEQPVMILGTLAWQLRTIWEVKHHQEQKRSPGKIAELMGSKPFVVEKAMRQTGNFSRGELRRGFANLSQADLELKTSGKNPQIVLESLVLKLCSGSG